MFQFVEENLSLHFFHCYWFLIFKFPILEWLCIFIITTGKKFPVSPFQNPQLLPCYIIGSLSQLTLVFTFVSSYFVASCYYFFFFLFFCCCSTSCLENFLNSKYLFSLPLRYILTEICIFISITERQPGLLFSKHSSQRYNLWWCGRYNPRLSTFLISASIIAVSLLSLFIPSTEAR